jgi:hypothetical protein
MTAHAETPAPEISHVGDFHVGDSGDPRLQAAIALKFEPTELRDFELADKAAGQMMGKLLAFLFCVLLFLMIGVNIWMTRNAAKGTDPQAPVGVEVEHSKEAGHH